MSFDHAVASVALSGAARRCAACARHEALVYDFDARCVVFRVTTSRALFGVALSASGRRVLCGGADRAARLYDVATAALLHDAKAADRVRPGRAETPEYDSRGVRTRESVLRRRTREPKRARRLR